MMKDEIGEVCDEIKMSRLDRKDTEVDSMDVKALLDRHGDRESSARAHNLRAAADLVGNKKSKAEDGRWK